jgi:NAD(P)H dehydrogenase (quinone)
MKILIVYDSRTGNTEKMAYAVRDGVLKAGVDAEIKKIEDTSIDELPHVEGLILGSPVYYGLPTGKIKQFIDESVKYHGKLDGKIGGAFTSSGGSHSGAETTLIALIEALLIHGMVIQGTSGRNHYGPASVGSPEDSDIETCKDYGERLGNLVKKIHQ